MKISDVNGFLQTKVHVCVLEQKKKEQFLWSQFGSRFLISPDYLPGLFMILENSHGNDH